MLLKKQQNFKTEGRQPPVRFHTQILSSEQPLSRICSKTHPHTTSFIPYSPHQSHPSPNFQDMKKYLNIQNSPQTAPYLNSSVPDLKKVGSPTHGIKIKKMVNNTEKGHYERPSFEKEKIKRSFTSCLCYDIEQQYTQGLSRNQVYVSPSNVISKQFILKQSRWRICKKSNTSIF